MGQNRDLWRQYFAAAMPAAALFERHDARGMAQRAAQLADAMLELDGERWPVGAGVPALVEPSKPTPKVRGGR